jgi:mono/diheme cytochrome c family protein
MSLLICSSLIALLAAADVPPGAIGPITSSYPGPVQQAFETHCADCHGKLPANLPAEAATTAQKKAKRAHRKFNMDDGFPFRSKWPLPKLMAEIREAVEDEDMPPKKYMKQKGRAISAEERRAIVGWAADAVTALKTAQ